MKRLLMMIMLVAPLAFVGFAPAQADPIPPHQAPGVPVEPGAVLFGQDKLAGCTVAHWHETGSCAIAHDDPTWACVESTSAPRATETGWKNSLRQASIDLDSGEYVLDPLPAFTRDVPYPGSPADATLADGACRRVDHLPQPVRLLCMAWGDNSTGTLRCNMF